MPVRHRFANAELLEALALVAPGTPLRAGIERIVRAKGGALLVVNDGPEVLAICSGGFLVDAPFSPQRLSELAKMDGAIILSANCDRIARANVHLVPDPTVPTSETGTRHRTAERVAKSLKVPVISASEEMGVINLYAGGSKHQLQDISRLLDRANQALQTLERYKVRLEDALLGLTSAELEDAASLRDVASVLQRGEMVNRIAEEIETMIVELGIEARLLRLQLDEIYSDLEDELELVVSDYVAVDRTAAATLAEMAELSDDDVLDLRAAAATLHRDGDPDDLDQEVVPKGLRLLNRVHRLSDDSATKIVEHFGGLAQLQRATVRDLVEVDGVDDATAASIKETLQRVTESAILDQYS
jgi:diadenylate cyclase